MASSSVARRRIAVAVSGGVDSSVAAYLLCEKNYDVVGLHMQNWDPNDEDEMPASCSEQDRHDAEAVCQALHIPLHHASFASEYWSGVFEPFVEGISKGRMPNPDVRCNSLVKFGAMKEYAKRRLGLDWIATGHYARLWNRLDAAPPDIEACLEQNDWLYTWGSSPLLLTGADLSKDQSYFLAGVNGDAFHNVLFPLGDLHKKSSHNQVVSVRELAERAQLPTAKKRESMGICFVGKRDFTKFIHPYLPEPPQPGAYVDVDTGEIVGQHDGSALLKTIGQGAKISGASQKWFVVERAGPTTVLVCAGTHHPALYSSSLVVRDLHWIGGSEPAPLRETGSMRIMCRTRHLQPLVSCEITGSRMDGYTLHFDRPVRATTPGQLAAIYVDGLICLGGGAIWQRGPTHHELGLELPSELHPAGHNDLSIQKQYGY